MPLTGRGGYVPGICTTAVGILCRPSASQNGGALQKEKLAKVMKEFIAPIREKRMKYEKDQSLLLDILKDGSKRAQSVAAETLGEVREKMKLTF